MGVVGQEHQYKRQLNAENPQRKGDRTLYDCSGVRTDVSNRHYLSLTIPHGNIGDMLQCMNSEILGLRSVAQYVLPTLVC